METENKKQLNLEEAYKSFVNHTVKHYGEQLKFIAPQDMYYEHNTRMDILSKLDDFCILFVEHHEIIFDAFKEYIVKWKEITEFHEKRIENIFNFLQISVMFIHYKPEIDKWNNQFFLEKRELDNLDVINLDAEDITQDKDILDITGNITEL